MTDHLSGKLKFVFGGIGLWFMFHLLKTYIGKHRTTKHENRRPLVEISMCPGVISWRPIGRILCNQ